MAFYFGVESYNLEIKTCLYHDNSCLFGLNLSTCLLLEDFAVPSTKEEEKYKKKKLFYWGLSEVP